MVIKYKRKEKYLKKKIKQTQQQQQQKDKYKYNSRELKARLWHKIGYTQIQPVIWQKTFILEKLR